MIPPIHLNPTSPSTRSVTSLRAFPLNEFNMPKADGTAAGIMSIIDFLDVERSRRYIRTATTSFSCVYVHDYAHLMGAYVPRVWWTDEALMNLNFQNAVMGRTVREMEANDLSDWFHRYGAGFGWQEVNSTEAQISANQGECVIMFAASKNRKKPGHIVAVVPETDDVKCVGANGIIIYPVMSQAGYMNKKYFCSKWWDGYEKQRYYVNKK